MRAASLPQGLLAGALAWALGALAAALWLPTQPLAAVAWQQCCLWGLPALAAARMGGAEVSTHLGLLAPAPGRRGWAVALAVAASAPLADLLTFPPDAATQARNAQLHLLLQSDGPGGLAVRLAVFALLPAVCEELFFRGWLQRLLAQALPAHAAVWLAAAAFGLAHAEPHALLVRSLLGAALGYLAWGTRSTFCAMLAHAGFNAVAVLLAQAGK